MDWISHHPINEPLFKQYRVCTSCGVEKPQGVMRWTGTDWLCPEHYDEMMTNRALGALQ